MTVTRHQPNETNFFNDRQKYGDFLSFLSAVVWAPISRRCRGFAAATHTGLYWKTESAPELRYGGKRVLVTRKP